MKTPFAASDTHRYFIVAAPALVAFVQQEVQQYGGQNLKPLSGGVLCEGDLALGYRLCLHARFASRVLLQLATVPAKDGDTLYQACRDFPWEQHITADASFAIRFNGESAAFRHNHYGALRIKDGLCDRLRDLTGRRPDVDRDQPQLVFSGFLRNNRVTLYLELSGEPLHKRGYRRAAGEAPLKETLACAVLAQAGWQVQEQPLPLVDPLCGSGTLVLEGVLMALNLPTGLWRDRFGFEHWLHHDARLWAELRQTASEQRDRCLSAPRLLAWGFDDDETLVQKARANAERLGLSHFVAFETGDARHVSPPVPGPGLVVCNPPYGERLGGSLTGVSALYRDLGNNLRQRFAGWQFAMITSNADLAAETGLQAESRQAARNGALDCEIWSLRIPDAADTGLPVRMPLDDARLTEWRQAFANRLDKNARRLKPWLQQSGTDAYRLYDADIPEFALAVDRYGEHWHIAEYAPPDNINSVHAAWRRQLALDVVQERAGQGDIALKTRERQRGSQQYTALDSQRERISVREGEAQYWVNLHDYLDTGVFLDHRALRRRIHAEAQGKRFLNLFCYTATATVQAALGGALSSLSVDLSNTYLKWAERNFYLNRLNTGVHRVLRANCLDFLRSTEERFDLILLDPPSFSNSKRTETTLDVQRDHGELIEAAMRCLTAEGSLYFSTNRRKFRLDAALSQRYRIRDITAETLDPDFRREPPIHRCWHIQHGG